MELIIVRHGQTDANESKISYGQTDIPINKTGESQVHELGKHFVLSGIYPEVIICSDLTRAKQTAQILAGYLSVPVQTEALLKEMSFGELEGANREKMVQAQFGYDTKALTEAQGETVFDLEKRVNSFLLNLKELPFQKVMAVSHAMFLSVMCQILMGEELTFETVHAHKNADYSQLEIDFSMGSPHLKDYRLFCLRGAAF